MTLGLALSPALFRIIGAEENVLALGVPYARIIFGDILFMLLNLIISSILKGAGDSRTPLKILLLTDILNVVLVIGKFFQKIGSPIMSLRFSLGFSIPEPLSKLGRPVRNRFTATLFWVIQ